MNIGRKTLYNYLVNTFDISREKMVELFEKRVTELFEKHIKSKLDSDKINNMILSRITVLYRDGFYKKHYYESPETFEAFVRQCVAKEVKEIISNNFIVELKIKE